MKPKRFALLGDPVAHSRSPAMHAAAYRALHLDCTYEAIRATPFEIPALVRALREGTYDGFNLTLPHKRRILEHVDRVDESASNVGAANTLVRAEDGSIVAHNTDVPALAAELAKLAPERTKDEWKASIAIVLGSGGAGAAAIDVLVGEFDVHEVLVRARRPVAAVSEALAPTARDRTALTIIQATSAGMEGADPGEGVAQAIDWARVPSQAIALDVVYAPPETPFLRAASARGLRCANGLGMLARQGALAFELWLGIPAPYDAMLAALR